VGGVLTGDKRRLVRLLRDAGLYAPLRIVRGRFPAEERRRWREARRFRRTDGRTLRGIQGAPSGPKVLFAASSTPGLYRIRVEAMVAKALEARGCHAVWVVDRHDIWHEEHLRAFGFRDFVFFDDYAPSRPEAEARAAELLGRCANVFDVLDLNEAGYDVGFHAASRALNRLRRGTLDLADPEVTSEFQWALTNSLVAAAAVEKILVEVRPDKHVATAQNLTPWAEFYEGAQRHGVDTLYWMPAHVEEALLWRRYSYEERHEHFFTLAPETWSRVKEMPWTGADADFFLDSLRDSYITGNWFHRKKLSDKRVKTAEEITAELGLDPAKKTAFVFSHVLYDATFWFGKNLFADYVEWLVETAKAAAANPNVNWVIKLHPENVRRWVETVGRYELDNLEEYRLLKELFPNGFPDHVRLMTPENDTSTLSLFEFADYAITVRGTIGLEFPCFGVPTLTAGTGGYSERGFTIDSRTREEYLERLAHLEDIPRMSPEETALAQRFSYGVFHLKPVPFTSFEAHLLPDEQWDRGWNGHSFDFRVRTADELRTSPDLARFADWALQSQARDLLGPTADARLADAAPPGRVALTG
jgi:hypothetical protein